MQVFDWPAILNTSQAENVVMAKDIHLASITWDKEKLKLFFNNTIASTITSGSYTYALKDQLQYANRLLQLLQKEYHLEHE